jgi:large subunit ribosomal protein L35
MKSGVFPIGSRRRRAALQNSDNIPFELLPYQSFQEARKILQKDREEKLVAIGRERLRIDNLAAKDPSTIKGGEALKQVRLAAMKKNLEKLKILADINDPLIKKRFEDGLGMCHLTRILVRNMLIHSQGIWTNPYIVTWPTRNGESTSA